MYVLYCRYLCILVLTQRNKINYYRVLRVTCTETNHSCVLGDNIWPGNLFTHWLFTSRAITRTQVTRWFNDHSLLLSNRSSKASSHYRLLTDAYSVYHYNMYFDITVLSTHLYFRSLPGELNISCYSYLYQYICNTDILSKKI